MLPKTEEPPPRDELLLLLIGQNGAATERSTSKN